jgi:hypothetical protein
MEDRNVSPGFFVGVMGLVGVSVVKNPNSGFHVMMARVSARLDMFAAFSQYDKSDVMQQNQQPYR